MFQFVRRLVTYTQEERDMYNEIRRNINGARRVAMCANVGIYDSRGYNPLAALITRYGNNCLDEYGFHSAEQAM